MAFDRLTDELNTIETLPDTPNRTSGISAQQMKEYFDANAKTIKQFINDTLISQLENGGAQNVGFFPNEHFPNIDTVQAACEFLYDQIVGITLQQLVDGSVTSVKLYQGAGQEAVVTTAIRDLAVTTAKIAALAITTAKIANGAITTDKIADGAVTSGKLGNGAVTTAALNTGAVSAEKLANNAVTEGKLGSEAVTNAKIKSMAASKLTGQTAVANGGTGSNTAAGARTNLGFPSGTYTTEQWTFTPKSGSAFTKKVVLISG